MNTQKIKLWAPRVSQVLVEVNGDPVPMIRTHDQQGWWETESSYPAATRYGFFLDGEGPLPDPRSHSQPDGIHGLSELIDHSNFEWTDQAWQPAPWDEAVLYELHIGTYSEDGTFESTIGHLEHLVRLGITHVEILPVAGFPGSRNWGYDCVSLYAPNLHYGGPEALKKLVDACHAVGLAVVIDVIYNHMGHDGNYVELFGPYFTDKHPTPWGKGPNLDGAGSDSVRSFFIENALMWLRDYHADGLRLDAIDKVVDDSSHHFLAQLREAVDQLAAETGRPRCLIAESAANDPIYVIPLAAGGYGMDAQWADDIHHSFRTFLTGDRHTYYQDFGDLNHIKKALKQGFVYDGCYSSYRREPHGKDPTGLPPKAFMAFFQNHDQVGNRPFGDRFHHHENGSVIKQKIGSAFILLSPFTPMIFMGEEWAASTPFQFFTDHQDPVLAANVGDGRRKEFGGKEWEGEIPDPQDIECFQRSKLKWGEAYHGEHAGMLGWYTELIRLRKSNRDVGHALVDSDEEERWLRMRVGELCVTACFAAGSRTLIPAEANASRYVLSAGPVRVTETGEVEFVGSGVIITRHTA